MRFGPNLKRYLPRSLFARTILIILIPLAVAQLLATWIFYDRHYQSVSGRLAMGVAGEIALVQQELDILTPQLDKDILARLHDTTDLDATLGDGPMPAGVSATDVLRKALATALSQKGVTGFQFGANDSNAIVLYLPENSGQVLTVHIPLRRMYTPTTFVFLGWMVGSTAILVLVSLLFMRNQIRPIRRLALAAERFGRTLESESFKPEGALEIRQAAAAFLVMRSRLRRMIEQRTAMLAAISHDLRTPLTRLRLGLALLPQDVRADHDIDAMDGDITEMERMIGAYLAFARGEDAEPPEQLDLAVLAEEIATRAATVAGQDGVHVWWKNLAEGPLPVKVRREPIRRALTNLLTNAAKYGRNVWVTLSVGDYSAEISVEDDGPGIPEADHERVFKPFFRLESENTLAADRKPGHGLGLTIARDIARAHGGDVVLSTSAHAGLKATLRLPV